MNIELLSNGAARPFLRFLSLSFLVPESLQRGRLVLRRSLRHCRACTTPSTVLSSPPRALFLERIHIDLTHSASIYSHMPLLLLTDTPQSASQSVAAWRRVQLWGFGTE